MIRKVIFSNHGFRNLLFFLLLYLFISPFLVPYPSVAIVAHSLLSLTLFFSVWAVQKHQRYRSVAMVLLIPVLALYWLGLYEIIPFDLLSAYFLLALFYKLLVIAFAGQLIRSQRIDLQVIYGTLCLYLILGLFWGALYSLLHEVSPGSFAGVLLETPKGSLLTTFNYFSMVTLTTLGYGDITPQNHAAGALCQIEAITGQFYIAVVVAWLVGNFIADRQNRPPNN
ncbi:MAG: potassium channel family protein [Desulfocapsaceae bacterium]